VKVTKDQFLGVVRHVVTVGGTLIAATGVANADVANQVAGAVLTLAAFGWSLWEKRGK
jgi:hypothetical protein